MPPPPPRMPPKRTKKDGTSLSAPNSHALDGKRQISPSYPLRGTGTPVTARGGPSHLRSPHSEYRTGLITHRWCVQSNRLIPDWRRAARPREPGSRPGEQNTGSGFSPARPDAVAARGQWAYNRTSQVSGPDTLEGLSVSSTSSHDGLKIMQTASCHYSRDELLSYRQNTHLPTVTWYKANDLCYQVNMQSVHTRTLAQPRRKADQRKRLPNQTARGPINAPPARMELPLSSSGMAPVTVNTEYPKPRWRRIRSKRYPELGYTFKICAPIPRRTDSQGSILKGGPPQNKRAHEGADSSKPANGGSSPQCQSNPPYQIPLLSELKPSFMVQNPACVTILSRVS
jgi:hypothetical protein